MPNCQSCDGEFAAEDLTRHERAGVVRVHCPDCGCAMGTYRDPAR
jgi:hypothetical protein